MKNYRIAVVGVGPRGLGILERIIAIYADMSPNWSLQIDLIDPNEPGQGAHVSTQPDHLLANTVAGQITMFTDDSVRDAGPIKTGPSLLEWAQATGYRKVQGRFIQTPSDGEEVHENDYLPRRILGEYLTWVFDYLCGSLPKNMSVIHHRRLAWDIKRADTRNFVVELEGGSEIYADHVVITTGHSENGLSNDDIRLHQQVKNCQHKNEHLQFISSTSTMEVLKSVSKDAVVGIQGMGLTAYDVISQLTIGRGGRFVFKGNRELIYRSSGREPKLIVFSRQGIPFCARAINQKGIGGLYRPRFFTRAWIDSVRKAKYIKSGSPKLDFMADLWPTLKKEMCFAYSLSASKTFDLDSESYIPTPEHKTVITRLLFPFLGKNFNEEKDFSEAVRNHIEEDLKQASGGNVDNPLKAATDVLRDVRDLIRYAVDYGGLTEESHRVFLDEVVPNMYRLSAGAPMVRNMELLALVDAGIASFGPGQNAELHFDENNARFVLLSTKISKPSVRSLDVLVKARIDTSVYPQRQKSLLIQNLLNRGMIRPFMNGCFHPGGIDVTTSQNVIDVQGQVQEGLWALGIVVEGPNFCTYVLPRAQVNSRFIQFSGRCALKIVAALEKAHFSQYEDDKNATVV